MIKKCLILLIALSACMADTDTTATANTLKCADGADENCGQCTASKCTTCWEMYPDTNGICQAPTTKVANCQVYASATLCAGCETGYTLVSKACVKNTVANCAYELVAGTCTLCNGYSVLAGKCDKACPSNCKTCAVSGTAAVCAQCNDGYKLTASLTSLATGQLGDCEKAASPLDNCVALVSKCVSCFPGGYVNSKSTDAMTCKGGNHDSIIAVMVSALFAFLSL